MNIDILDKAPQFPGGPWVNHVLYGTILGLTVFAALLVFGVGKHQALEYANVITFFISASKKIYDYVARGPSDGQTIPVCVGKTFVTCLGIFLIWVI